MIALPFVFSFFLSFVPSHVPMIIVAVRVNPFAVLHSSALEIGRYKELASTDIFTIQEFRKADKYGNKNTKGVRGKLCKKN